MPYGTPAVAEVRREEEEGADLAASCAPLTEYLVYLFIALPCNFTEIVGGGGVGRTDQVTIL